MKLLNLTFAVAMTSLLFSGQSISDEKLELISENVITKIAFGSCADEEKAQPIWGPITRFKPDLFLFLGDNIYGDKVKGERVEGGDLMASLAQGYQIAGGEQHEFNKFRRSTPHMFTWDDHDYGLNDAGAELPFKQFSKNLFLRFWQVNESDERYHREGVYYSKTFGPEGRRVQIIMLDTRSFRTKLRAANNNARGQGPYAPSENKKDSILGEDQWRWLEEVVQEKSEIKFIVSSIQIIADQHRWEKWGNFPNERQKLFDLIVKNNLQNVIFISGDRHFGAIYEKSMENKMTFREITASSLTNPFMGIELVDKHRLGRIYKDINFGTAELDWKHGTVAIKIRNANGKPVLSHKIPLNLP